MNEDGSGKPLESDEMKAYVAAEKKALAAYAVHQEAKQLVVDAKWAQKEAKVEKAHQEIANIKAKAKLQPNEAALALAKTNLQKARDSPPIPGKWPNEEVVELVQESDT